MIVYVNGDSHSAGAEAVNSYAFANDDSLYLGLGRQPHPDNLRASYGCELANLMGAVLDCDAESASSNDRIMRTTREYLVANTPQLIVIGWSSWEREEWLHNGQYWQVNGGGIGHDWPAEIKQRHRDWVLTVDYHEKTKQAHEKIWQFHQELENLNIRHLFFNCFSEFRRVDQQRDWGDSYLGPYNNSLSYSVWLNHKGFQTVKPGSYHYGADAHQAWAKLLFNTLQ